MSSSSEEEIEELLRNRIRRQPRSFEQRRLLDVQHPREFRQKFRLPIEAFGHLLEAVGPQLEHRTRRNRALTAQQQLLVFLLFLGTNSFYHVMHSCHGISTSTVWNVIDRVTPAILSLRRELICWTKQSLTIASKFHDIAGFPCVAGCVDGTHVLVNPPAGDEDAYVNRHLPNLSMLPWFAGQITQFISVAAAVLGDGTTRESLKRVHCGLHLKKMHKGRSLEQ